MYYDSYEDYMRNSGYGYMNSSFGNGYNNSTYPMYYGNNNFVQDTDFESMYPEIYKKINPIVELQCVRYQNKRVSKDIVEEIADNVYRQYSESRDMEELRTDSSLNKSTSSSSSTRKEETRAPRNNILMDLIRILIIKNLLQNRPGRPNRPPMRSNQGMPQYQNWQGMQNMPIQNMPPQYEPRYY